MKKILSQITKNKILGNILGLCIIILIWSILTHKSSILPSILQVLYQISTNLVNISVVSAVFYTLNRAILAYLITLILAIIVSNLCYKFDLLKNIINPIISLFKAIPTISLILIVILLIKLELITYIVIFIISFPILYESILNSLNNIDDDILMANKIDNVNSISNYLYFYLPLSFNGIVNGILQTFGLSIKIQIMSELLTGSTKIKGVGMLLNYYKTNLELTNLFSITFIVIIIVYLFELLIKSLLKRTIY